MQKDQQRLLILSSLGGTLEFYDFIIFALFASYISNAFFPATDELVSLLITFATFAIGYLVRPLGGIIFGHFGDKIGRKTTFTVSILIMALATIGIGFIPTYSTIGIAAPLIVISLRILQGISIGGEIPGAITYVTESLPQHKGLACGIIFCALLFGIVLGSIVHAAILTFLPEAQMQAYGWRIPFIAGGVFGLLSYLLRKELHESAPFLAIEKSIEKFPIVTVFKQQFSCVVAGGLIVALCAAIVTGLFLFNPAYFTKVLHLPNNAYIWERTAAIAFGSVLSIVFGYLTDVFNIKKLVRFLAILTACLAYPIFTIYAYYPSLYPIAFIASSLLLGLSAGFIPPLLSELFPTKIRYSGIAVSYNLGFALFGGLTPLLSLSLIYYTGWVTAPALYLILVALLTILSLVFLSRRYQVLNPKGIGHPAA
ncbi:major facilitator family transporter [Legionella maceachernii]|uniref:Major facilitator family transporter n=1 Tax=Legionella maceachernii TaxID=466 RepID=A0A0W0WFP3_9GAMM|nr:major facilitator family transporter [Legionella maceachernii]SJZ99602.1 Predicted arabinose efflux permease, MFS family [Legionella maceachernii]SUP01266.1 Proline porter II [Legionella maceachernii]